MLPTTLKDSVPLFRGVRFDVNALEVVGRDGRSHRKEVVVHPGAVVILPLLGPRRDRVVLIRNQRVAVGQTLWELPAGTLEPGEAPEACAARELIEETGYRGLRVTRLLEFYTSPGICTELMHAYVADGLEQVGQDLDTTEEITAEAVPLDEAMGMVRDGGIRDGKSVATLLYYRAFNGER